MELDKHKKMNPLLYKICLSSNEAIEIHKTRNHYGIIRSKIENRY